MRYEAAAVVQSTSAAGRWLSGVHMERQQWALNSSSLDGELGEPQNETLTEGHRPRDRTNLCTG